MNRFLIVSDPAKKERFCSLLSKFHCDTVTYTQNAQEAKQALAENEYDFILVNDPLPGNTVYEFCLYCIENTTAAVLLLAKNDFSETAAKQLLHCGVCMLKKPCSEQTFLQTLQLLHAAKIRFMGLKQENKQLQKRIHTAHVIDRAKLLLMERLSLTEEQAYSYIKHHAMDMRVTKEQVARAVLTTYGGTDLKRKEE